MKKEIRHQAMGNLNALDPMEKIVDLQLEIIARGDVIAELKSAIKRIHSMCDEPLLYDTEFEFREAVKDQCEKHIPWLSGVDEESAVK